MKKRIFRSDRVFLLVLVLFVSGCAAVPPKPSPEKAPERVTEKVPERPAEAAAMKDPFSVFPERYRQQAMDYEKSGELPRALLCWEIVLALKPADEEAGRKRDAVRAQMESLADTHFKRGLSHFQNRAMSAARKEFLLTLYYRPDHPEALSYLKHKLNEEDYLLYEVKEGDTLKGIAKKIYNDPQKDFLVAYFNDLGKEAKLTPKTILRTPALEGPPQKSQTAMEPREMPMDPKDISARPDETQERMRTALAYFKANKFSETVAITEEILATDPANKAARDLTNASHYQVGKSLYQGKKYQEALDRLSRVDPGYRDVSEMVGSAKKQLAEVHYLNGIKLFTQEKLDQAIEEWDETLKLNPQHPKAKADRDQAVRLLQRLKEIK